MKQSESNSKTTGLVTTAKQFIKFGLVGVSNTLLSLAIYYILVFFGCNYIFANTVAFIISVLNAYFWQNRYVFDKGAQSHIKAIAKVYIAYGFTFIVSTFLLFVMVSMCGVSKMIAPVLVLVVSVPMNFIINKFWAYKDRLRR